MSSSAQTQEQDPTPEEIARLSVLLKRCLTLDVDFNSLNGRLTVRVNFAGEEICSARETIEPRD